MDDDDTSDAVDGLLSTAKPSTESTYLAARAAKAAQQVTQQQRNHTYVKTRPSQLRFDTLVMLKNWLHVLNIFMLSCTAFYRQRKVATEAVGFKWLKRPGLHFFPEVHMLQPFLKRPMLKSQRTRAPECAPAATYPPREKSLFLTSHRISSTFLKRRLGAAAFGWMAPQAGTAASRLHKMQAVPRRQTYVKHKGLPEETPLIRLFFSQRAGRNHCAAVS